MDPRTVPIAMLYFGSIQAFACGSLNEERSEVRAMAIARLDCPSDWLGPHVEEADDAPVRHWSASCNHRAVRISCSNRGCSEEVQRPRLLCDMPLELTAHPDGGGASSMDSANPAPLREAEPSTTGP
jgi:hypothetical protein